MNITTTHKCSSRGSRGAPNAVHTRKREESTYISHEMNEHGRRWRLPKSPRHGQRCTLDAWVPWLRIAASSEGASRRLVEGASRSRPATMHVPRSITIKLTAAARVELVAIRPISKPRGLPRSPTGTRRRYFFLAGPLRGVEETRGVAPTGALRGEPSCD